MTTRRALLTSGLLLALILGSTSNLARAQSDAESPLPSKFPVGSASSASASTGTAPEGVGGKAPAKRTKVKWEKLTVTGDFVATCAVAVAPSNPKNLYVGLDRCKKNWRSTNRGRKWSLMNGLPDEGSRSILVDPQNPGVVFAAFGGDEGHAGLFRSLDAGETWERLGTKNGLKTDSEKCFSIIALRTTPPTLLVFCGTGIFRSTDGGYEWTRAPRPEYKGTPRRLAVAQSDPNIVYALASKSLSKSTDAGKTWARLDTLSASNFQDIVVHPVDPGVVYLADYKDGVHRSADGGNTWTRIAVGFSRNAQNNVCLQALAIDPASPTIMYAGGDAGFYASTDAGKTWRMIATVQACTIVVDPGDHRVLYVGASYDLWRCKVTRL